jgi:hypothetical protein
MLHKQAMGLSEKGMFLEEVEQCSRTNCYLSRQFNFHGIAVFMRVFLAEDSRDKRMERWCRFFVKTFRALNLAFICRSQNSLKATPISQSENRLSSFPLRGKPLKSMKTNAKKIPKTLQ